jgi:large subunit ribosomal protein L24
MRRTSNKVRKLHVRKGDLVYIRSGDDKGKSGRILSVNIEKQTAIIESINFVSKHIKRNQNNPTGAKIEIEAPIHISKLMLFDPKTNKPTRIGRRKNVKGFWERYSVKSKAVIETKSI